MKNGKLNIQYLQNDQDCRNYQLNSNGGFLFPVGTVVLSGCIMGEDCATMPFIPNAERSGIEQCSDWIDANVFGEMEKKAKRK
jgi:hypothetical protein